MPSLPHPDHHLSIDPTRPSPTGGYAVLVVRQGSGETRIGPIDDLALADRVQDFLARQRYSSRGDARGSTVTVTPYDRQREHLALPPTEPGALHAALMHPEHGMDGVFPNTWDQLCAQYPYAQARAAYDQALEYEPDEDCQDPARETAEARSAPRRGVPAASPGSSTARLELTSADGAATVWRLADGDPRLEQIHKILGPPDPRRP